MNNPEAYSDTTKQFLLLVKEAEERLKELKQARRKLDDCMRMMPLGFMFQDPEDKVVYQIIAPSGTFIEFKNIDYIRTRKEGEKAGTLSMKAAQEAGFSPSIPGGDK
jgi:hypothetical protein